MSWNLSDPRTRLRIFLFLVAAHSLAVGLNLIFFPPRLMTLFGYAPIGEPFFKVQGGVFHLVMVTVYTLGAWDPHRHRSLVLLSVIAKGIATVFLVTYYVLVDPIIVVLLSGIGDALMGLVIALLHRSFLRVPPSRG
jgi:hypothetical protein